MIGKTMRILLADGGPTGILLAEISNWTGKVLIAPRSQLDQLSEREEVRRTGVYLPVGPDPDDPSRVLTRTAEPILMPETADERDGTVPNVVFPTAVEEVDGVRYVFYGMADSKIGVARLDHT